MGDVFINRTIYKYFCRQVQMIVVPYSSAVSYYSQHSVGKHAQRNGKFESV